MARSSSKAPTSSPATGAATKPPAPPSSTAGSAPATSPTCSPDGYYTLCGRKSDLIISGGFNIYPREIEEFLQEQEEVAEAAVIGLPDPVRGEVPVAYIVCRRHIDPADLTPAAATSSPPSKSPEPSTPSIPSPATPWAKSKNTSSPPQPDRRAAFQAGCPLGRPHSWGHVFSVFSAVSSSAFLSMSSLRWSPRLRVSAVNGPPRIPSPLDPR